MEKSNKLSSSPREMKALHLTIKGLELELEELRIANAKLNRRVIDCTKTMDESKKSENRLRAFFEQSNHASMVLDPNTLDGIPIIIEANKTALETHGYTREEFVGRSIADVDDQAGKLMVLERTQQMLNMRSLHVENIHVRKDGTTFPNEVYATRVDIDGEPPLIFTTEHDITKRKLVENKLKISEDRLKQEVHIKNKFFSIIAHDLKNPFNSLLGTTQMMSQMANSFSKEELVECATNVNEDGHRVFNLLQNLLDWSRLQMEGSKQEPKIIQLAELTQESMNILNLTATEKDISLANNINNVCAFADQDMVRTVILNLITNAIKFSLSGGSVGVSASNKGKMVQVTVTDTGIGMTENQLKKIFSLIQPTSTTGTAGEQGTGLGLPLCKEMIERNKGEIWAESTLGEGSRFHFTLPITPSE